MKPLAFVLLSSCTLLIPQTPLSPQAEGVHRTYDAKALPSCKFVSELRVTPPYISDEDVVIQFRNQAAGLGADTIFVSRDPHVTYQAQAYTCKGVPLQDAR